jgi:Fic family protein
VRNRLPEIDSRELIDVLFEQPYVRIGDVVDAGIVGRQAASRYLKSLVSIGLLEEHPKEREVLFIHRRLLHVLADDAHAG